MDAFLRVGYIPNEINDYVINDIAIPLTSDVKLISDSEWTIDPRTKPDLERLVIRKIYDDNGILYIQIQVPYSDPDIFPYYWEEDQNAHWGDASIIFMIIMAQKLTSSSLRN